MSKVSPLDFQGLVSSFHYHSINDSHGTISCAKCLVKAWLKNLGHQPGRDIFTSTFP